MSNNYFTEQQETEQYVASLETKVMRLDVEAEKLAKSIFSSHVFYCDSTGDDCKTCAVYEAYRKFKGEGGE